MFSRGKRTRKFLEVGRSQHWQRKRGAVERDYVLSDSVEDELKNVPEWYQVSTESGLEALAKCGKVGLLDVDMINEGSEPKHLPAMYEDFQQSRLKFPETFDDVEGLEAYGIDEDGSNP